MNLVQILLLRREKAVESSKMQLLRTEMHKVPSNMQRFFQKDFCPSYQRVKDVKTAGGKNNTNIFITADSGAADSVLPVDALPMVPKGKSALEGTSCSLANGMPIYNQGQKTVKGTVGDGTKAVLTFQLTEVHKALASVGRMTEAGCIVHFDEYGPEGSYIEDRRTRKRTKLHKRNGVFVFPCNVDVEASTKGCESEANHAAGFPRPPRA